MFKIAIDISRCCGNLPFFFMKLCEFFLQILRSLHGEGICLVLETRQAPPKKPGAEKAKTKGVPQMLFFASAILDWSLILGRGGGAG